MVVIALTVALLVIAPVVAIPEIEADLSARTAAALQAQGHGWASASARGRTLTVAGEAPDAAARAGALDAVAAVDGVGDVVDETTLSPALTHRISLTRMATGISLDGSAPDRDSIDALLAAIAEVAPAAAVANNVAVDGGTPAEGWQDLARRVVALGAGLIAGQASLTPDGIVVEGAVASDSMLAIIEDRLADVGDMDVRIDVTVERPRTYALTVTRGPDGLVLAGEVPDASFHDDLIALAERQGVPAVESEMLMVVPGVAEPEWANMARALVRHVASMREGRAELAPGRLSVTGVVVDPAMADMMQTALSAIFGANEGIAASIDIQAMVAQGGQAQATGVNDVMAYGAEAPIPELADSQRIDAGTCQSDLNMLTSDAQVRFVADGATLDPESLTLLEAIAVTLRACPGANVEVSGHTDSSGDPAADEVLSQRRAEAVVAYLVLRGVERDRLLAAGYGDQIPVADNATDEGRIRNRRIEFLVDLTQ